MTVKAGGGGAATIGDVDPSALRSALGSGGVFIDIGAATVRVRSDVPALASALRSVYRNHEFYTAATFSDVHVDVVRPRGVRRWWRRQAEFRSDGFTPFDPFPAANALPLLEWGVNWLIGQRFHHHLLLHAGVVTKDGRALLMPATPGSGKSTLTAALSLRGWRLLSDEFAAWDLEARVFRAVLKPVALKNESIAVIRAFDAHASLGPEFPNTRKGTVAHLASDAAAVARRHVGAGPGIVVFPRWKAGSPLLLEPVEPHALFGALAFNAFNYKLLGRASFDAVVELVRQCRAWQLVYSDLNDAIGAIEALWTLEAPRP